MIDSYAPREKVINQINKFTLTDNLFDQRNYDEDPKTVFTSYQVNEISLWSSKKGFRRTGSWLLDLSILKLIMNS
jgi:hypothetical protein